MIHFVVIKESKNTEELRLEILTDQMVSLTQVAEDDPEASPATVYLSFRQLRELYSATTTLPANVANVMSFDFCKLSA